MRILNWIRDRIDDLQGNGQMAQRALWSVCVAKLDEPVSYRRFLISCFDPKVGVKIRQLDDGYEVRCGEIVLSLEPDGAMS